MKHDKVGSVMTSDTVRAGSTTPFKEVARLLADHHISGLPVIDEDDKVIGVVSETDLTTRQAVTDDTGSGPWHRLRPKALTRGARKQAGKAAARTAGELMTTPAVTVHADDTIAQAARTMARWRVERLPVLDEEDRLVGIVTRRDLLQVFLRPDTDIRHEVVQDVLLRTLWLTPGSVDVSVDDGVVTLTGGVERRSEAEIAVSMTRQTDGVVAVVDRLTHRLDDTGSQPDEQAPHGVADDWLRGW
ncbi:CBS domain-containing protein [Streptomyces sp. NPDC006458]|uniref:CBS domain-containing protein n=1 Tax=Streptomyces sp. NPDC006458 TaxID=3154302 RepID=UPI0033AC7C2B